MSQKIFKEGKKYTFSDYFEMCSPTEEILAALGYSLTTVSLQLPQSTDVDETTLENLRTTYYAIVSKISLNSETAKREVMIAPVLQAVIKTVDAKLNIEYPVEVNERLSGLIDYFFRAQQHLVVIEAKKGDLEKGFNQLAAEMIAIDQYEDDHLSNTLYGAISIGEVWRFAMLERGQKKLSKDIHTFRFPEDLNNIFSIFKGILA